MLKKAGIVLLLALMFMFSLTGCGDPKHNASGGDRFVVINNQGGFSTDVKAFVDVETGVTYALYAGGYGVSITPLYNADGTLCVYDLAKLTDK